MVNSMQDPQHPGHHYYDGVGAPDGFGHGHYNANNGFNRRPIAGNPLGWAAIRGAWGGGAVDVGGNPWDGRFG